MWFYDDSASRRLGLQGLGFDGVGAWGSGLCTTYYKVSYGEHTNMVSCYLQVLVNNNTRLKTCKGPETFSDNIHGFSLSLSRTQRSENIHAFKHA